MYVMCNGNLKTKKVSHLIGQFSLIRRFKISIISLVLDWGLQRLIRQRLMNLTTRMMIKGIFLTNYRVQAF